MKKIILIVILVLALLPVSRVEAQPIMAQSFTLPETELSPTSSYPPGNTPGLYEVQLNSLPGNSIGAEIIFTRTASVNAASGLLAVIEVFFWRDMNDGRGPRWVSTWGPNNFDGGILLNKDGSVAATSYGTFTWPGEAGPDGKPMRLKGSDILVRATVLQTFRTSVTINSISHTGK